MSGESRTKRAALDRLADALAEDILSASDVDILSEFAESGGDPERHAAEMRALFEKSVLTANKKRLAAAKAGAAAGGEPSATPSTAMDIAAARARLRAALDAPHVSPTLTLAARKESELSDADILSMLDDLRELGVLPDDDGSSGN